MARSLTALFLGMMTTMLVGCAGTDISSDQPLSSLPAVPVAEDMFVVEIGFAIVDTANQQWHEEVWLELDELVAEPEQRRLLLANGFRSGLAGEQLPELLRQAVNRTDTADQRQHQYRRLHVRAGHRSEVVTTDRNVPMTVLVDQHEGITGHQFDAAQGVFAIQVHPDTGGRARIELVPEIHFGDIKQQYVGQDGAFVLQSRRDRKVFQLLKQNAVLSPGQTLIVTGVGPDKSLGGNFFRPVKKPGLCKLLLIRLIRAQQDRLFATDASWSARQESQPASSTAAASIFARN